MENANLPKGLLFRGSTWHIDKQVKGARVCKSLGTNDVQIALVRFKSEIDLRRVTIDAESTRQRINAVRKAEIASRDSWRSVVESMREDATSWVYSTLTRLTKRGKASGKGCTLTVDDLADLLLESDGKCMISNIPFSDEIPQGSKVAPFLMSVDRIQNEKGYHFENCRIVCLMVNVAMRDWGEAVVIRMAEAMMLQHLKNRVGNSHALREFPKVKG